MVEVTAQEQSMKRLLVERFHITTGFHPDQQEIIERLLRGERVLAIQRTGWGKSLCYQLASLFMPFLVLVLSPLRALMRDQCQRCNNLYALPSAILSADRSVAENREALEQAIAGKLKILFIAPERLDTFDWLAYLPRMRISMLVIDEAHCISLWGHDFRPHYRRVMRLLSLVPEKTTVLALTATASRRVEDDILQFIGPAHIVRGTLQRPNLYLHVVRLHGDWEKLCYLGEVLQHCSGTGLVYTATRASAVMVATFLNWRGIRSEYYHAGRDEQKRQEIEKELMRNGYNVVCSTTALGMGLDKPDIRFVIHYHAPTSPVDYYQEIGRAGRDGKIAWGILLYDPADLQIAERLIGNHQHGPGAYQAILAQLRKSHSGVGEQEIVQATGLARREVRSMLGRLEEQQQVTFHPERRVYTATGVQPSANTGVEVQEIHNGDRGISQYEAMRQQKLVELQDMRHYALLKGCYMHSLTQYLGDVEAYRCGNCGYCCPGHFPPVQTSQRIQLSVTRFLEEAFMPAIEKYSSQYGVIHEPGWALSYHGRTRFGKLIAASKFQNAGPYALAIVLRAVEVIKERYPLRKLNGVISVPPTGGNTLVELFARQVAELLDREYLPVVKKIRPLYKQKSLDQYVQKESNVRNAFVLLSPESVRGRILLLIDDIYDSGCTMREVSRIVMRAGAKAVYPLTITRTMLCDERWEARDG
jgi:ATP-dependent DNA helicase RecQ